MPIRTLIVDDEPLARDNISLLLAKDDGFEEIGTCSNGFEALTQIKAQKPGLVFLDVQMPQLNGMEVAAQLDPAHPLLIVFVTAYDDFAVQAFELNAVDYLLKPFSDTRFQACLNRIRKRAGQREQEEAFKHMQLFLQRHITPEASKSATSEGGYVQKMLLNQRGSVVMVACGDIDWIEAAGNYAEIHVGAQTFLHRQTMAILEAKLDPAQLVRIHRGTMVNVDRIVKLEPQGHGDFLVHLKMGKILKMSRGYRERLWKLTGGV